MRIPSMDGEIEGHVAEIAPSADPNSRTFLVRIDLPTASWIASRPVWPRGHSGR